MITIVPYNPLWPAEYALLAAPIQQALGAHALRIDHIGSTAVPGLAAKDVIDMQVTVAAFTAEIDPALAGIGYQRRSDITRDHLPPGADPTPAEWQKWYFRAPAGQRPTHLHMRIAGRANQRYALLFRDYLRAHPPAAAAYGLIKQELARYHANDTDAYYAIKDPVCDLIWQAAQAWASTT